MYENDNPTIVKLIKRQLKSSTASKMFMGNVLSYNVEKDFLPLDLFLQQKMQEIIFTMEL